MKYFVASEVLYIATMLVFKIALGLFYLRIVVRAWEKKVIYTTILLSTLFGTAYFFLALFQCGADPPEFFRHEAMHKCVPFRKVLVVNIFAGVINALTDWIFALLPIFILRRAQLGRTAKIATGAILMLGSLGSICSVIRITFLKGLSPGPDLFRTAINVAIWSVVEPGIGIIASSLATFRPLFSRAARVERSNSISTMGFHRHALRRAISGRRRTERNQPPILEFSDLKARTKAVHTHFFDVDSRSLPKEPKSAGSAVATRDNVFIADGRLENWQQGMGRYNATAPLPRPPLPPTLLPPPYSRLSVRRTKPSDMFDMTKSRTNEDSEASFEPYHVHEKGKRPSKAAICRSPSLLDQLPPFPRPPSQSSHGSTQISTSSPNHKERPGTASSSVYSTTSDDAILIIGPPPIRNIKASLSRPIQQGPGFRHIINQDGRVDDTLATRAASHRRLHSEQVPNAEYPFKLRGGVSSRERIRVQPAIERFTYGQG